MGQGLLFCLKSIFHFNFVFLFDLKITNFCLLFRLGLSYYVLYCLFLFHLNLLQMLLGNNCIAQIAEAFWTILSIGLYRKFCWLETEVLELVPYSSRYELLHINKSYPFISGYEICLVYVVLLISVSPKIYNTIESFCRSGKDPLQGRAILGR